MFTPDESRMLTQRLSDVDAGVDDYGPVMTRATQDVRRVDGLSTSRIDMLSEETRHLLKLRALGDIPSETPPTAPRQGDPG